MIRQLRRTHAYTFIALAFLLPAILLVGLKARHPRPKISPRPPELSASNQIRESRVLWSRHAIQSHFYRDTPTPGQVSVRLDPDRPLDEPDLLLYWVDDQRLGNEPQPVSSQENSLPGQAQLLGTFASGKPFPLPPNHDRSGHLILYSLAHRAVVDTARVENLP